MREDSQGNVVDSTKGRSMINPLSFKGDVLVQVWMDSRVLATVCKWMERQGTYPRFMSQVVRQPMEILCAHIVDNEEAEMVDDTVVARALLEGRFHIKLNKGGRGQKNVMHNTILSSGFRLGDKLGEDIGIDRPGVNQRNEIDPATQARLDKQRAIYEELRRKKEEKVKANLQRQIKAAKAAGLCVEDDGEPVKSVKEGMSEEEFYADAAERDRKLQEEEDRAMEEFISNKDNIVGDESS